MTNREKTMHVFSDEELWMAVEQIVEKIVKYRYSHLMFGEDIIRLNELEINLRLIYTILNSKER